MLAGGVVHVSPLDAFNVVLADFNKDKNLDVLTPMWSSNVVNIGLGVGNVVVDPDVCNERVDRHRLLSSLWERRSYGTVARQRFRRSEAFETLQKLFLGYSLNRDLGIIGIDAGSGRTDQRHRIRLRLVDLDEFLQ